MHSFYSFVLYLFCFVFGLELNFVSEDYVICFPVEAIRKGFGLVLRLNDILYELTVRVVQACFFIFNDRVLSVKMDIPMKIWYVFMCVCRERGVCVCREWLYLSPKCINIWIPRQDTMSSICMCVRP